MTEEHDQGWAEADSEDFIDWGRFFVPQREEQLATICSALPEPPEDALVVELCCGEGLLSEAILEHYPSVRIRAYDGSATMLDQARERLADHGSRFEAVPFDLAARDWRALPEAPWAVVSSLAVHHLDGAEKRRLFADLCTALRPGGALVLADLVLPATESGLRLAAEAWDRSVRERSHELAGDLSAWESFERLGWNLWLAPDADPIDKPSTLFEQMRWLEEAGFSQVDVFWMKAGHAIYGGIKPAHTAP